MDEEIGDLEPKDFPKVEWTDQKKEQVTKLTELVDKAIRAERQTLTVDNLSDDGRLALSRRHHRDTAVSLLQYHVLPTATLFFARRGIDADTANDLAGKVFLRFWLQISDRVHSNLAVPIEKPLSYLYGIERNTFLEYFRDQSKKRAIQYIQLDDYNIGNNALANPPLTPEELILAKDDEEERISLFSKAMAVLEKRLSQNQMELIRRVMAGQTIPEIAEQLNIPPNSAHQRLHRVRKQAQKVLKNILIDRR